MIRLACCLLTLLGIGGYACADCFARSRFYTPPAVVKKDVVVVKEAIVASFVAVPLYAAVYTPPVVPAAPAPAAAPAAPPPADQQAVLDALKALNANLQALDRRLQALEGKPPVSPVSPPVNPPAPSTPPPGAKPGGVDPFNPGPKGPKVEAPKPAGFLALAQAKCAQCHEAKVSAAKGGGLTLLDGPNLARLDDRQLRKLAAVSYAGRMPPKPSGIPPLTDEEVGQVMEWISAQK